MQTNSDQAEWERRVSALLEKTVENGTTLDEEKSSVQRAYLLTRQHGLDIDVFKVRLSMIGKPQRYLLTQDGFLVPAATVRPPEQPSRPWDGTERRRSTAGSGRAAPDGRECAVSPSGQHRWVPFMRGTFPTGIENCAHCGARKG